jgi:hypothetical protein
VSNRIRLLFNNALEGTGAHVGNRALRAMEELIAKESSAKPSSDLWITHQEWMQRGRPAYSAKRTEKGLWGPTRMFLVTGKTPSSTPPKPPIFKDHLERAQWLWNNLPEKIRAYCHLKICREGRARRWRRSVANPRMWGWASKFVEQSPGQVGQSIGQAVVEGGIQPLQNTEAAPTLHSLYGTVISGHLSTQDNPWNTPAVAVPDMSFSQFVEQKLEKLKKAPPKPDKTPKHKLVPKVSYQSKTSASDGEAFYKPVASKTPISPDSKEPKPRLRIGVWS